MAVSTNDNNAQVLGGFSLYTGLAVMKVLAVNPTKEELEVLGYKPKEEPKYTGIVFKQKNEDGSETEQHRNKVVFYLGNGDVKVKYEILVAPEFDIAGTGSQRIINKFGQYTYSKTGIEGILANPKMSWFESTSARQAHIGEVAIIDLIKEWVNVANDGECSLDNISAIVNGDVSELKNYVSKFRETHEVITLLGVKKAEKDGKTNYYQSVYARCFSRPSYTAYITKFMKSLSEQYGDFKDDYQGSLEYKKYEPKLETDTPDAESSSANKAADF